MHACSQLYNILLPELYSFSFKVAPSSGPLPFRCYAIQPLWHCQCKNKTSDTRKIHLNPKAPLENYLRMEATAEDFPVGSSHLLGHPPYSLSRVVIAAFTMPTDGRQQMILVSPLHYTRRKRTTKKDNLRGIQERKQTEMESDTCFQQCLIRVSLRIINTILR